MFACGFFVEEMDLEIYSDSDSDCDSDDAATPPVKKARLGAATYKTKFNSQWIKELPFISNVMNDPYKKHSCHYNDDN